MKAVIFDFDGTLTEKRGNLWRNIWNMLGYDTGSDSYYASLYKNFINGKITHKEWCDLTCEAFKNKEFSLDDFDNAISNIKLMDGLKELFEKLYNNGIEIHIVSGNIIYAIEKSLGENKRFVTKINANKFVFDEQGVIKEIIGTKYDYEGKAKYVEQLMQINNFTKEDILFIGNSSNDEWVHETGIGTVCFNPDQTKSENRKIWNKVVLSDNLIDLEDYIYEL